MLRRDWLLHSMAATAVLAAAEQQPGDEAALLSGLLFGLAPAARGYPTSSDMISMPQDCV